MYKRQEQRRELAQEVDRLQFAVDEIDGIAPEPGEDEELVQLVRKLQDVDGLRESAEIALASIDGTEELEEAASALLGRAVSALAGSTDKELAALGERLGEISSQLGDISGELGGYLAGLPADPHLLERSLQRQQELRTLTRKYAGDIDGVVAWRNEACLLYTSPSPRD